MTANLTQRFAGQLEDSSTGLRSVWPPAGMSEGTVRDFESGKRTPNAGKLSAMRQALEAAGVQFHVDGLGVRLQRHGSTQPSLAEGEAGIIANSDM